jgi:hypothetical protein
MKPTDTAGLGTPAPRTIRAAVTITLVVDVRDVADREDVVARVHGEVSSRVAIGVPQVTAVGQPYVVRAIARVDVDVRS